MERQQARSLMWHDHRAAAEHVDDKEVVATDGGGLHQEAAVGAERETSTRVPAMACDPLNSEHELPPFGPHVHPAVEGRADDVTAFGGDGHGGDALVHVSDHANGPSVGI